MSVAWEATGHVEGHMEGHVEGHGGPWTVEDVLALDKDRSQKYELLDGSLVMSPAAGYGHQFVSRRLANQIETAVEVAKAPYFVFEATNVRTSSQLFIPDIVVADSKAVDYDTVTLTVDAALLVVELVSPGNSGHDRILKPALYAQAGIPAYWRVELKPRPQLIISELAKGVYRQTQVINGKRRIDVAGAFPMDVDVPALAAPLYRE